MSVAGEEDQELTGAADNRRQATTFVSQTWMLYLIILPLPLYYLRVAGQLESRSVILPQVVSWIMVALAASIALSEWSKAPGKSAQNLLPALALKWWRTVAMLISTVALVGLLGRINFYVAAGAFLFVAFSFLGAGNVVLKVLYTSGVLAGCYLLFEIILGVRLP